MVKSMTAFARKQMQQKEGTISWEMRSVNGRYLDMNFRLPEMFRELELKLREIASKYLQRGKFDATLRFQPGEIISNDIIVNNSMVEKLKQATSQIRDIIPEVRKIDPFRILNWPGVMQVVEGDKSKIFKVVLETFEQSLQELVQMKTREGEKLEKLIEQRLVSVASQVEEIREKMPEIISKQNENILAKFTELKIELDANRLEQEMVMFAQKTDISEEVDRLDAHVVEVRRTLQQKEAIGRRLDFLMQELNREANTIGSKSVSEFTTKASVDLKVLIEQMREQVQNIE